MEINFFIRRFCLQMLIVENLLRKDPEVRQARPGHSVPQDLRAAGSQDPQVLQVQRGLLGPEPQVLQEQQALRDPLVAQGPLGLWVLQVQQVRRGPSAAQVPDLRAQWVLRVPRALPEPLDRLDPRAPQVPLVLQDPRDLRVRQARLVT